MKKNIKNTSESEISLTKKILISANVFYFLIFLGFCFTTNIDHPTILHKYTVGYLKSLFGLLLLIIPYNIIILFLLNNRIFLMLNKRTFKINLFLRIISVVFFFVLILICMELFLRMKPKPYVEDFHPFLQAVNTQKNEGYEHVNSDGFRYDEMTVDKPKEVYRIFLMGGSTAFDEPRSYDKSISKVIEDNLRSRYPDKKIQVINAANNRYTSEHSLIMYETKVIDYHPDLIVLFQGYNDMIYSCTPPISPIRTYKNDYSHLYEVLDNIINNYFNWDLQSVALTRLAKAFDENFYADIRNKFPPPQPKIIYTDNITWPSLDAYTRNTTELINLTKADNVKMILGNQPIHYNNNPKNYALAEYFCKKSDTQYISMNALNKGISLFNNTTQQIAQKNNIPFVDIASQIPRTDIYLTDDVHYTDEGDKKVANILYNAIIKSGYLENQ